MHEIDFAKLEGLRNQEWILELVRQLDRRFVKREELPPLVYEAPEPRTTISDTAEPLSYAQCRLTDDEIRVGDWVECTTHDYAALVFDSPYKVEELDLMDAGCLIRINGTWYRVSHNFRKVQPAMEQPICAGCRQPIRKAEAKYSRSTGWWHWHCLMNRGTDGHPDWKVCPIGCGFPPEKKEEP